MNNCALRLTSDGIVITISTTNPAADAARYLKAIQRVVKNSMMNEYTDFNGLQDLHALLELLELLNPVPDERELKLRFGL